MALPLIFNAYRDADTLRIVGEELRGLGSRVLKWEGAANGQIINPFILETDELFIVEWPFFGIFGYINLTITTTGGTSEPFIVILEQPPAPLDPTAPGNIQPIPAYDPHLKVLLMEQYREGL